MSRRPIPSLGLLALLVLLTGLAVVPAAVGADDLDRALREAEEPLRARDWEGAARSLRAFREQHPASTQAVEAWVLEAQALLEAGHPREALEATSGFLAAHGEAAWAGRVRHVAAAAYAGLGDPKQAAVALRERVEAATSAEARAAIGARHLELADRDFDGVEEPDELGRPVKKRDVARAYTTYVHAREVGVAPDQAWRVRERIALCLEELGRFAEAAAAWGAMLDDAEHPEDVPAPTPEMLARTTLGRGRARLRAGQRGEAREDLKAALTRLQTLPLPALQMEVLLLLGEERFLAAQGADDDVAFEEGVTWIRRAILEHKDDPKAKDAQWRLAEAYDQRGQAEKAAAEWSAYVERFPEDDRSPEARDRQAQALARAGRYDEAVQAWERFLAAHPNHPLWQSVREKIVAASFAKGQALRDAGEKDGAVAAWQSFAERYPTDGRAASALRLAGEVLREQERAEAALVLWRQVGGRYADTPEAPRALLLVAYALEDDLGRLDEAVKAYEQLIQRYPRSGEAREARARLERLQAKHLELRMDRVVEVGGKPVLRVVTRNVPELGVRVYRLEAEEYFRRKGTLQGVENLQLEVVKPDATATWAVDGYERFRLTEADREVPVEGPGAYVVVAGDEDLTATVLFLVSDLETVVKRSPGRQLFVWAFARADQAPVEGARVLVAEGGRVREVGTTGADGVWKGEAGHSADHVLVMSPRGAAGTEIQAGPTVASGFTSKAYVYTDRPVYRPGQEMRWRAVFLRAQAGAYLPPSAVDGRVAILDARGQQVVEEAVRSSAFGSFAGTFAVDAAAPLGTWTVRLEVPRQGTWSGSFEVQEYRKPELTIEVEPSRPVYLTGETVKAVAHVRYAFGGVVDDAPVRYEVYRIPRTFAPSATDGYAWYVREDRPDESERMRRGEGVLVARGELRTDDGGDAHVEFETRERDEDAEYVVRMAVQDVTRRWVGSEGRIPVTRADHMAVVQADRQVYRPKQEMRVEVRTVDALERPVSRSGTLLLLQVRRLRPPIDVRGGRRPVPVELREEEVEKAAYPVTTGAAGSAELRVPVPGPGTWRLRWRATDGRGALVTAYTDVEASGEAEDLSRDARLTAARNVYVEGEEAEVLLQSPVTGVLALVTHEAETVLEHRFVRLDRTSTLLSLPVRGEQAPNVFFQVAIPGGDRLLEATAEVIVLRHLDVDVELPPDAKPGEKVEVRVSTKDARGTPTPAEVSVALVDETLFAVAPDRAGPIRPYFLDRKRQHGVTTATSLGFVAYGTTRETNKDLLAEEAIRRGEGQRVAAESALRNARDALRRGDLDTAVQLALEAARIDPQSWGARSFLLELRSDERTKGVLERFDRAVTADALREAQEPADAPAGRPAATPAPAAPSRGEVARNRSGEEDTEDEEMNDAVGIGGGAGGSYGGRGGARRARAAVLEAESMDVRQQAGPVADARLVAGLAALEKNLGDLQQAEAGYGFGAAPTLEVRRRFADVAWWGPQVVTGANGVATVEVELPDNLTTWRATVRGVSGSALVGEGRGRVTARKDLLVRVDAPRFLTDGDHLTIPIAVHNETGRAAQVQVRMEAEGVDLGGEDAVLVLPDGARGVSDREVRTAGPGEVRLDATAVAGPAGDRVEVRLGTIPRGIKVVEGRTGTVATERGEVQETFLDVPEGAVAGATRVAVVLHPGIADAVLDALLYLRLYPYGCIEQTVHRYLPALDARSALLAIGSPAAARLEDLDLVVRDGAVRLRNLQNPDGSFGWFRGGSGDLAMTAYGLLGLVGARQAGVGDLDLAIQQARDALLRLVDAGAEDVRALAHLALSRVGVASDAYAITFRRRSDDLSVPGLAWMTLAAKTLGRSYDVDELVRLLMARRVEEGLTTHWTGREGDCFVGSAREATALAVQALLAADPRNPQAERGLRWLIETRPDGGFGTTKETAAFVGAAAAWVRASGDQGFGGAVDVLLDGAVVRTIDVGTGGIAPADRRFLLPEAARLAVGRHRLAFRLRGEGRLAWAARMEATVASEDLPADSNGLVVERTWLRPELAPVEGQEAPVKPGYEILRPTARPRVEVKPLEAVEAGDHVLVRVRLVAPRDLDYVLVEDPLPAGFEVLEGTAKGPFDWQERRDDRQVFFLTKVPKGPVVLEYVIQATHWGAFTALGTTAGAMYLPEVHGRAAGSRIRVVRGGAGGESVEVPPTPDEIWGRAQRLFAARSWDEAGRLLRALRDEQPLRDEIIEEIEHMLLVAAVAQDDAREIVRAREALVRRNPARIPGDWTTQRRIAFAYQTLGEDEAAANLYRDLVARGFGLETDWADVLTARGEELEALDAVGVALERFPANEAAARVAFRRAQRYRELPRPEGRQLPAGQPMDEEALDALWSLTAHYAATSVAAPASYAVVEALRRAGRDEEAARGAETFLARFPDTVFEDDAWWFLAETRFRAFEAEPDAARAKVVRDAARPLVERSFRRADGRSVESEFRERAWHLLARVHHVLGELDQAIALYRRATGIEDAREALAFLTEERLELEKTWTVPLAGPTTVPVTYRNVKEVSFKAYPVDLRTLFTVRKSLEGLHEIDLSGLVPAQEWTVTFTDAGDHRGHRAEVTVPVEAGTPGAWLLLAKAGDHEAQTLVIKTDLRLVLQRIGEKVRVYVTDGTGAAVRGAYVTVADGQRIRARGVTDGRGVFEAPGAGANAAVVVALDDRYAVAR